MQVSAKPTFDTLQFGKPRFASPSLSGVAQGEGGGGCSTNVCTARFRLEVQALTLLYTIQPVNRLNVNPRGEGKERVTLSSRFFSPFPHTESPFTGYKPFFLRKKYPFRIPSVDEWCLFHIPSVSPLDHFTDPNGRFSHPFVYFNE